MLAFLSQESTMASLKERILNALQELGEDQFSAFKGRLGHPDIRGHHKPIPSSASRVRTAQLIYQTYTSDAPQVMVKILQKISRTDLLRWFPEISTGR